MNQETLRLWYGELPILTYGEITDLDVVTAFKTILQWKRDGLFISTHIPNGEYTVTKKYWLYLGLLSHDCIDYGGSPRGGLLTDFGNEVLDLLNSIDLEEFCNDVLYMV